ncbi:MAG TPA: hypothetical protein VGQ11_04205, partial [Candidatus Acidoferrales bacterium]|nr:hypothetical protein [Candidatus Acidoferrales bacterium]
MTADPTPVERLVEIRTHWPAAVKLAEPLALAARIEPELMREVRLALFAKSHASLEAELYFSPLVAQRTPQWLVLDTSLAHQLQDGLASAMKRRPKARPGIRHVRELVQRAHTSIPFEIAREEEMIWLAVERPHGKSGARNAINDILLDFLTRLVTSGEQAPVVARWFASAARRLPLLARETPAFALLGFAASSVLGGRKIDTFVDPTLDTFEALTTYLPQMAKPTTVWAALTTRGLHFVPREMTGYQSLEVPLTNPVLLETRVEGEPARLVTIDPGQPLFVPLSRTPVVVRTLRCDLLTFRASSR